MIIRDYIKNEIYDALNFDIFRFEDFTVDITSAEDAISKKCNIKIMYDKYFFNIILGTDNCWMKYSPGSIFLEDSEKVKLNEFFKFKEQTIHNWLLRIKNDMLNPLERRFLDDNIHKFREEIESKLDEIEDDFFTKDEGDELRARLDQLEKMILERDSQEELHAEITKMKEEIEFLKATIDNLSKKRWVRNALVKMWSWGQKEENRKLIESGFEVVKAISQVDIPKV